ncbi:putative permease [Thioflavicoccus mobilis 8321]|uniref:Putative permease n=1 Tax=Thioflavicoccus mobilis 8321 TaxID=765912 RepID=L0GXR6_9GAMM|nr:AI-2E family transporter [Thioflavicoccus mobilis]AGA90776.1 putative permease [Thioflavicoccus mobilis 8321]
MTESTRLANDKLFHTRMMEAAVRIGLIAVLAAWCFDIVRPLWVPIVWGLIIAVAAYPGYRQLRDLLGGRRVAAAVIFTLLALVLLIIPAILLSGTLVEGVRNLAAALGAGTIRVPPPPPDVAAWPIVGDSLAPLWEEASLNLEAALTTLAPQLQSLGKWALTAAAGAGLGIVQFVIAIVIGGVILANAEAAKDVGYGIAQRLTGESGHAFADLAEATVHSVARGILGVALIQSTMAGLGFLAAGVPGAGLWALIALILSVLQIGVFLVVVPVVIYVFTNADTLTAILFLIWSIFVSSIDNILKPLVLGRGVAVPMGVVFIGAIGGLLSSGILGLFVGAVVLVLGYKLLLAWLGETALPSQSE